MAKICEQCGNSFKTCVRIGEKIRNLGNRKYCLTCSPFGSHNTARLKGQAERKIKKHERDKIKYKKWQRKARKERKEKLVAMFGNKCEECGYDKCIAALEFHHRDRSKKRFSLGLHGLCRKWDDLVAEAKKCRLLCSNCHAELHYKEGRG